MANAEAKAPSAFRADDTSKVKQHPVANAAFGMVSAGLGAAAAAGLGPIVVPALLAGGVAGYFLTNKMPAE